MSCGTLKLNSDNTITLEGLWNPSTEKYVNDATVVITLKDKATETELTGQSWPLTLAYVTGSNGDYSGTVEDSVVAEEGQEILGEGTATSGTLVLDFEMEFIYVVADQTTFLWTSRDELEKTFGETNVSKWADLENQNDADEIAARIRWAVEEATSEAKERLLGSPVDLDELRCAPRTLRIATTRLAGVLLYESRGVKDTGDEKGAHRLHAHLKRADAWFRKVQAGLLRISSDSERTMTPKVRKPLSDDEEVFERDPIVGV